ncbi:hypothetical protein M3Y97_00668900 [Aphelenchoides bicaudatus]|nr:hypothetical protein M3Y97_00668900 [Aphelenchoides bicaudatus]
MTKDPDNILPTPYSNVLKLISDLPHLIAKLSDVYEAVECLQPIERIIPILKAIDSLPPTPVDENAVNTIQRLLIVIANIDFDRSFVGRKTPYSEEVFYFLNRLLLFPQLIERNNKSLTKIIDCSLNHLIFLHIHKQVEDFEMCKDVLAGLMQKMNPTRNANKFLASITSVMNNEPTSSPKTTDYYFDYLQKQTKQLRNAGVFVLWSLLAYFMNNVDKSAEFNVSLQAFLAAVKLTYESKAVELQTICIDQLVALTKSAGNEVVQVFPEICEQLNITNDHPIIVNAEKALSKSNIQFDKREEACQQLQTICTDVNDLLNNVQKFRLFNKYLASPEHKLPLPVEFAIGTLLCHPSVTTKKLSAEVLKELELCRQLSANLLQCRKTLLKTPLSERSVSVAHKTPVEHHAEQESSSATQEKQSPQKARIMQQRSPKTPPLLITLDDSPNTPKTCSTPSKSSHVQQGNQNNEPSQKRQRASSPQIDYAQIYATDSQIEKYDQNEAQAEEVQAGSSKPMETPANERTLLDDASKTPSKNVTESEPENLVDLF